MSKRSSIEQAIQYVKERWNEGKTLKEIASLYKVDPGNLDRAFKRRENSTIKDFVGRRRVEFVLAEAQKSGQFGFEIGRKLGFVSDASFYRWVKRAFGKSYREIQDEMKGGKEGQKGG